MDFNTVYVGMDVHKDSFTLCSYTLEDDRVAYIQKLNSDYKLIIKYLNSMRDIYGRNTRFICGYEAGCLGYYLARKLIENNIECEIMAPTTMKKDSASSRMKNDRRDAITIAKLLATHGYEEVRIPSVKDEKIKNYLRMRDDHKSHLKKIKQQILSFCLRLGINYSEGNYWTNKHLVFLNNLGLGDIFDETLKEYMLEYNHLTDLIERLNKRIEEFAEDDDYKENVSKLECFIGIKTNTALAIITEIGDFKRFEKAHNFSSYIGLMPGEHSSGSSKNNLGITKAGNTHIRKLLIEASQSFTRGRVGYKSTLLKKRQEGNKPEVIAYADKANERLRRKYYHMVLNNKKNHNVAKTAIARELSSFIWGMMNEVYD